MKDITSKAKSEFVPEKQSNNALTWVVSPVFFGSFVVNTLCRLTF